MTREITDTAIEAYAEKHSSAEPESLATVAAATRKAHAAAQMMVGPLEGELLAMLVHCLQPALVLEIGTFTGYSALSMAAALGSGGRIITCEANPERARDARANFDASLLGSRIELREGPALDTITTVDGPVDLAFIDADKTNYSSYFEALVPKLARSGLIVADNTLWSGQVLDASDKSAETEALREFNTRVARDRRVRAVMLPVRDGVTLIRPAARP